MDAGRARPGLAVMAVWKAVGTALAVSLLAGPPAQAAEPRPPVGASAIAGAWRVKDSTAIFRIRAHRGAVRVTGSDGPRGERFVVTNIRWDGRVLTGDFLMPSTNWLTHSELVLVRRDVLAGQYADGSPEVWLRTR
ncbi:hypothetical protein ASC87_23950 [Rhizobacter sp. Root1221]|nr:hypothetical protein ASC87_23950 [Rhizobacter sp. Root1221]